MSAMREPTAATCPGCGRPVEECAADDADETPTPAAATRPEPMPTEPDPRLVQYWDHGEPDIPAWAIKAVFAVLMVGWIASLIWIVVTA